MRWLLLFLIVLNAVVLFWFGQQQKTGGQYNAGVPSVSTAQAPRIALLSELPPNKIKYKKAELAPKEEAPPPVAVAPTAEAVAPSPSDSAVDQPSAAAAPAVDASESAGAPVAEKAAADSRPALAITKPVNKDVCGFLGPFAEPITVRQVAGRLKRAQIDARLYGESTAISPIYWVYLRSAPTRAAALATLRQLQAARIESFIVSEGAETNAISLGFYKKKESAESVRQQRIAQGYDARLIKKERQRDQYWAVVSPESWSRVDAPLVAELGKEYGEFTRRTRKCSFVASLTQFE